MYSGENGFLAYLKNKFGQDEEYWTELVSQMFSIFAGAISIEGVRGEKQPAIFLKKEFIYGKRSKNPELGKQVQRAMNELG